MNTTPSPEQLIPQEHNPGHNLSIGKYQFVDEEALHLHDTLVAEWSARADEAHARDAEQPEVTHDGLGLKFKEVTLYHGSRVHNIDRMQPADEATVGNGIYATSMPEKAFGYARVRSSYKHETPMVYELVAENIEFVDLREWPNVDKFMQGYADVLESMVGAGDYDDNSIGMRDRVEEVIALVRSGDKYALKDVTWNLMTIFTDYVVSHGFDGIIADEGGEFGDGMEIGRHDSWVIIQPEMARITDYESFQTIVRTDYETINAIQQKREVLGLEWWEKIPEEE